MIAIILCHNEIDYTTGFVNSVLKSTDDKTGLKIVMVNNASTDKITAGYLQEVAKDNPGFFIYRENTENKLFTQACVDVINEFPGEDIYLLNNDIIVKDGWLHGRCYLGEYAMVGATQCWLVDPNLLTFCGGADDFAGHVTRWKWLAEKEWGNNIHDVKWLTFGACMISRMIYDSIGGFDMDFEFYCSDSDFSLQCLAKGFKIGVDPMMELIHFGGATTQKKMQDPEFQKNFVGRDDQIAFAEKWGLKIADIDMRPYEKIRNEYHNQVFSNPAVYERNKRLSVKVARNLFNKYNLKGKKILEIGCAYGNNVIELRKLGVDAYGIDFSKDAIKMNGKNEFLKVVDIEDGESLGEKYDFICSFATLEHIHDHNTTDILMRMYDALVDGGIMFHEIDTEHGTDRSHINIHSIAWWRGAFKSAGFKDLKTELKGNGMMKIEVKK